MVKALLYAVIELDHSLGLVVIMKLKADAVDEMKDLIHDSLQCQSSLHKYHRVYKLDSGVTVHSPSDFENVPRPHSP
jgi:hypothetical protein